MTGLSAGKSDAYRDDIQGIRAIGAVLIVVFHIWVHKVSGGVDVFFVVSGYLMAGVLLKQLARGGQVDSLAFWSRIVRRVAPSAYLVLLSTALLVYLLVPETAWDKAFTEILHSGLQTQNLHLINSAVDYLAREEGPSPVQQFWALSIQVQFYIVLNLVFVVSRFQLGSTDRIVRIRLISISIVLASFVFSVYWTYRDPSAAYFSPLTRGWEFFTGVTLALIGPSLTLRLGYRRWLGYIGLAILLLGGVLIPSAWSFPGSIALVPVGAAVCLILSGMRGEKTPVSRLLGNRYLVALGSMSFTLYLWHWVVLIIFLEHTGLDTIGLAGGLFVIGVSLALAIATKVLVEDRVRSQVRTAGAATRSLSLSAALFAAVVLVSFQGTRYVKSATDEALRAAAAAAAAVEDEPSSGGVIETADDDSTVSREQLLTAKTNVPRPYLDECHQKLRSDEVIVCEYGDVKSARAIAIVGGSHATQWFPALERIALREGLKLLNITKSGCPFGPVGNSNESCHAWNEKLVPILRQLKPIAIVTNSSRSTISRGADVLPASYLAQWKKLDALNIAIIGLRDNPLFPFDVPACVARNRDNPLLCSKERALAYSAVSPQAGLPQLRICR